MIASEIELPSPSLSIYFFWMIQADPSRDDMLAENRPAGFSDFGQLPSPEEAMMLFVASPQPMWVFDRETLRFLAVNDAAIRHYGYSREEYHSMDLTQIRPTEDVPLLMRDLENSIEGLQRVGVRRHLTRDGRRLWVEITVHTLEYNGRRAKLALVNDITEQRMAEQRVRESEERFRDLLQNVPTVAIQGYGPDGTIHYWNDASESFYGFSREEILGKNLLDLLIPPGSEEMIQEAIRNLAQNGIMIPHGELELRRKDGSMIHVYSSHAVVKRAGQDPELFCFDVDLSERRRNEMVLAASNRALQLMNQCGEALIRSETEQELISEICRLAVQVGNYRMAWVGYAQDDAEHSVQCMAHYGGDKAFFDEVRLSWSENHRFGNGPTGRALRLGVVQWCGDVNQDPAFFSWRQLLGQYGFCGLICLPMHNDARVFGVLVLYSKEVIDPSQNELETLQKLADNLAFGVENLRTQHERQRILAAVQKVAASVSASAGEEFFEELTHNMIEALGASAGFISRLLPGSPPAARSISAVVNGKTAPNEVFLLEGTPCVNLVHQDEFVVHSGLSELYPDSPCITGLNAQVYVGRRLTDSTGRMIGMIFLLFRERMRVNNFILSTVKIFATRVAAEMERLQADALMREQASLIDKAQDAIIVRDLNHRILYWNKSAERMYGWTAEESVGKSIADQIYQDPMAFRNAMNTTMTHGEWVGEMQQRTKHNETKVVEGRWSLVRDELGMPKSILVINTDITERKMLEQQFLRAQRIESIGTLAGGIAHDLNNVLAPILMSIDLLHHHVKDAKGRKILDMVGKSARRGAEMVRQVLSFSCGVEGSPVVVQVTHIVRDLMRIVEETFPKSVRMEISLPTEPWLIKADPTQIHQVLINLCVNARDAMPDGGKITITVENLYIDERSAAMHLEAKPGPYLKIDVQDTGHGIPENILDKVFDPFFTTKEVGKGTGLGLSTTLAIVRTHGGFIRVQSDPGSGTCFRFYLPALPESECIPVNESKKVIFTGHGETLLLVDDEAAIRGLTRQILESSGYKVLVAADGSEAISLFVKHREHIVLVITDMLMPVMDGPATIEVLRLLKPSLRIIGSGGVAIPNQENGPVNDFLQKPYTSEALLESVGRQITEITTQDSNKEPIPTAESQEPDDPNRDVNSPAAP